MTEEKFLEYPTYTDSEGIEWDSYEDYEIAKSQAQYLASRKRRSIFDDDAVPHAVN
jgi:hypothetical protein